MKGRLFLPLKHRSCSSCTIWPESHVNPLYKHKWRKKNLVLKLGVCIDKTPGSMSQSYNYTERWMLYLCTLCQVHFLSLPSMKEKVSWLINWATLRTMESTSCLKTCLQHLKALPLGTWRSFWKEANICHLLRDFAKLKTSPWLKTILIF